MTFGSLSLITRVCFDKYLRELNPNGAGSSVCFYLFFRLFVLFVCFFCFLFCFLFQFVCFVVYFVVFYSCFLVGLSASEYKIEEYLSIF